ncbi:MAG: hypothetical protein ACJ72Z_12855 [Pyrinomonadaceae bacterium]
MTIKSPSTTFKTTFAGEMNYYNYFTEIEDTFVRRRGKHLLLSPIDWAMIEGWQERGIPLHIVLRGIECVFDIFDKNPGPRSIKGLLYCREEIEAQYQEWLGMQVGRSDGEPAPVAGQTFEDTAIKSHIESAIDQLRNSKNKRLKEDFERAAVRLEELQNHLTDDIEIIDKSLNDIEHFLDHAILTNADKKHLKQWERETTAHLKPYKGEMPAEAYEQTFRLMLLKRIREELGVPRLGLFYL